MGGDDPLAARQDTQPILRILEERIDELADVIVAEHGKVHSDAVGEIQRGMEAWNSRPAVMQERVDRFPCRVDHPKYASEGLLLSHSATILTR